MYEGITVAGVAVIAAAAVLGFVAGYWAVDRAARYAEARQWRALVRDLYHLRDVRVPEWSADCHYVEGVFCERRGRLFQATKNMGYDQSVDPVACGQTAWRELERPRC